MGLIFQRNLNFGTFQNGIQGEVHTQVERKEWLYILGVHIL